jgi:hypothetical protein
MLDLGPRGRAVFCAAFFGGEAVLVLSAGARSDRSYGFQMFPETSSIVLHVSRRLDDGRVAPIENGRWQAKDCGGKPHSFAWGTMVRPPAPWRLDATVAAPYGVDSEVHRARDALRWVASHTPEDCETRAYVAKVQLRRNGRDLEPIDFEEPHAR